MKNKFMFLGQRYDTGEVITAYILLIPTMVTMLFLFVVPIVQVVIMSFTDYRLTTGVMNFNGLTNYKYLFTDAKFGKAMLNTATFAVFKLTLDVVLGLGVALMLDSKVICRRAMRTIYFSPVVVPVVACSLIWLWFYDPGIGPLNQILTALGLEPLKWLYSESTAMLSIIIFSVWHGLGYNVILLLAGLQNIPETCIEAAKVEGANEWTIIRRIKLPLLSPVISFVIMMGIINAFKAFSEVNVMTPDGGPGYSTAMAVNYIYEQAFTNGRMGRGAAASLILFAVIFILTMLKNKVGNKNVEEG